MTPFADVVLDPPHGGLLELGEPGHVLHVHAGRGVQDKHKLAHLLLEDLELRGRRLGPIPGGGAKVRALHDHVVGALEVADLVLLVGQPLVVVTDLLGEVAKVFRLKYEIYIVQYIICDTM